MCCNCLANYLDNLDYTEYFVIKFDNEELMMVGVGQLEPEGDFSAPMAGNIVCARVKGAKYVGTIVEEVRYNDIILITIEEVR